MSPLDFAQDRGVPLALLDGQNKNHEIDSIQSSDSSIPEHAQLRASEATAEEREPSISAIRPIGDSTPSARSSLTIHEAASDQATALPQQTARFASKELLCPWFPEADPEHKRAQTWRVRLSRRKTTLSLACVTAWVVFAINVVATISLPARDHNAVLYTGECKTASRIDSGLHILINFLASMLLGASNLCMQLLSAPTRNEVDRAHSRKTWLDIGVPSTRNLRHIAKERIGVWLVLAAASLPLHFLYVESTYYGTIKLMMRGNDRANSAIIGIKPEAELYWSVVSSGFLSGDRVDIEATNATLMSRAGQTVVALDGTSLEPRVSYLGMPYDPDTVWADWPYSNRTLPGYRDYLTTLQNRIMESQNDSLESLQYENISRLECLSRYLRWFETGASNLLLISTSDMLDPGANLSENNSSLLAFNWLASSWDTVHIGRSWPCENSNNFSCFYPDTWQGHPEKVADWNLWGYKIDYCLSKELDLTHNCRVEFNRDIMIVICVANFCKCLAFCYTLWIYRDYATTPLASLGDAAVSFLRDPDDTTRSMSLASRKNIDSLWQNPEPLPWLPYRHRWLNVGSRKLWFGLSFAILFTLLLAHGMLALALRAIRGLNLASLGFGQPNAYESNKWITPHNTIIPGTMFANSWQVMVSLIYVQYNALLTAFLVGDEWSRFACGGTKVEDRTPPKSYRESKTVTIQSRRMSQLPWPRIGVKAKKMVSRNTAKVRQLSGRAFSASARFLQHPSGCVTKRLQHFYGTLSTVCSETPGQRVRKTLRVSAPEGIQRSSYFVSMPLKYGIPFIAVMSFLHWLISQSIFVFAIDVYNGRGQVAFRRFGCGYSIEPIITACAVGWTLLLALIMLGSKRYPPHMPLASSCSAAISAACHPPEGDNEAHLFPIQWGVVSSHDGVGHCSLTTARDVSPPQAGFLYA